MAQQDFRTQVDMFRDRDVQIGAAVGLIVGLLLGWFVLGWWIAPVRWVDAHPSDLHPDWQQHYVAMVVDSYLLSGDAQTARDRLEGWDDATLASVFGEVEAAFQQRGATRQAEVTQQLADILDVSIVTPEAAEAVATTAPTEVAEPTPVPAGQTEGPSRTDQMLQVLGIVVAAIVIVVVGIVGFMWYQSRTIEYEGAEAALDEAGARQRTEPHIGSMRLGDRVTIQYRDEGPRFRESYQIYRGDENLPVGECGLQGVSTLSEDGRVVACAAWLYQREFPERSADSRVLASRRVYRNEALRNSLTPDRDPSQVIPAEPGQTVQLEHETVEMTLRVLDVEYDGPDEQYIGRLVVELEPAAKRREPEAPAPLDFG